MSLLLKDIFANFGLLKEDKFKINKFKQNNKIIIIISFFLTFEQIYYAFFVHHKLLIFEQIHLLTSIIMFIFVLLGLYFYFNPPLQIKLIHRIYEISPVLIGIFIASIRMILVVDEFIYLPTFYIAIIYGMAAVFNYSYEESFFVYFSGFLLLLLLLNTYRPEFKMTGYLPDIISNNLLAWIVSIFSFKKYLKEYENNQIIEEKNIRLERKNKQIREINNVLKEKSITDELTGLYNRRKIEKIISEQIKQFNRYNKRFSVIICDLDNFKEINDNYGHSAGDEVLIEVSKIFKDNIREVDSCGRWGGEEFLFVCPEIGLMSAYDLADRIRILIENNNFSAVEQVTASFGVAEYQDKEKINQLFKRVDDQLYYAKRRGRNLVCCS